MNGHLSIGRVFEAGFASRESAVEEVLFGIVVVI